MKKLARSITKWTKACYKRLCRLISYIHHTCEYKQYCHVVILQNNADLDCFKTPILREILRIQNPLLEEHCAFLEVIHLFQSVGCARKQTSVSHRSTESEIISLDAGLRLDGFPVLDLWCMIDAVLGKTNQSHKERRDLCTNQSEVRTTTHTIQKRMKSHGMINDLDNVDFIPLNANSSRQEALLYVFAYNEAVMKMIIKGRSPTMRRVSRTHRVALVRLFDRINLDPKIQIKYIDTKNQLADFLTRGNFTRDEWNHLLNLFNISHFSSTVCSDTMEKRSQHDSEEETSHSKIATNNESHCKGAVARIILDLSKPWEEKLWKSRSLEFNC